MGFRLGLGKQEGVLLGWQVTGFVAVLAVLSGVGSTTFTVFDLIILAAVAAATSTSSLLLVRRVRQAPTPRLSGDEAPPALRRELRSHSVWRDPTGSARDRVPIGHTLSAQPTREPSVWFSVEDTTEERTIADVGAKLTEIDGDALELSRIGQAG